MYQNCMGAIVACKLSIWECCKENSLLNPTQGSYSNKIWCNYERKNRWRTQVTLLDVPANLLQFLVMYIHFFFPITNLHHTGKVCWFTWLVFTCVQGGRWRDEMGSVPAWILCEAILGDSWGHYIHCVDHSYSDLHVDWPSFVPIS